VHERHFYCFSNGLDLIIKIPEGAAISTGKNESINMRNLVTTILLYYDLLFRIEQKELYSLYKEKFDLILFLTDKELNNCSHISFLGCTTLNSDLIGFIQPDIPTIFKKKKKKIECH
jgi:hypothetical protein